MEMESGAACFVSLSRLLNVSEVSQTTFEPVQPPLPPSSVIDILDDRAVSRADETDALRCGRILSLSCNQDAHLISLTMWKSEVRTL